MTDKIPAIVADLERAKALVWLVRQEIRDFWPTPDQLNSLRFALTEAGEADLAKTKQALALAWENTWAQQALSLNEAFIQASEALDGYLRTKQGFARNRDKVVEIADELADCALMLITALGPNWEPGQWIILPPDYGPPPTLESICQQVAVAANGCARNPERDLWKQAAEHAIYAVYLYCPEAIRTALAGRLARIAVKHTGKVPDVLSAPVQTGSRGRKVAAHAA